MGFELRVATGPQAGQVLALTQAELRIGRGAENDLVLADVGVSRRHLSLFLREGAWWVQDVGSANGSALNDVPLSGAQVLRDGDCLRAGPVELRFFAATEEEDRTRIVPFAAQTPRGLSPASRAAGGVPAVVRARRRGASGTTLGAQLLLAWARLRRRDRALAAGLALTLLLGMGGTLLALPAPAGEAAAQAPAPEPSELGATALPGSFGLGEGVTWERPDMKAFTFAFTAPTRAVALLRYRARAISLQEVSVSVNGVEQGWVAPDAGGASEREQELVLAPGVLRRNARNQLLFDNVNNPPGRDTWRIEGVRVEIIPVPELPREQLLASARESVARARSYAQQRAVGSENLFRAWKNYRAAWVTLEALDERPELYRDVRFALGQVSADLDRECARLLLALQRGVQYRDADAVRRAFDEVLRHFPSTEHRCHTLALEQHSRYSLGPGRKGASL